MLQRTKIKPHGVGIVATFSNYTAPMTHRYIKRFRYMYFFLECRTTSYRFICFLEVWNKWSSIEMGIRLYFKYKFVGILKILWNVSYTGEQNKSNCPVLHCTAATVESGRVEWAEETSSLEFKAFRRRASVTASALDVFKKAKAKFKGHPPAGSNISAFVEGIQSQSMGL